MESSGWKFPHKEPAEDRTVLLAPLLKILECPVCLDVIKTPFKLCQQGHLLCYECMKTLPHCPTCTGEFSLDNPVCIKHLLEALPVPRICKYYRNGCKQVVQPDEPSDAHETLCGFRTVKCRMSKCKEDVIVSKLEDHFDSNHASLLCIRRLNNPVKVKQLKKKSKIRTVPIFVWNTLFWLKITINVQTGVVTMTITADFDNQPINDYFIDLKFKKDRVGFICTLKALGSHEEEKESHSTSTMKVLFDSIMQCVEEDGSLMFYYEIYAKPKKD